MFNIDPWLAHYGLSAIFILLALGIVGLPIPDETIIVLSGVLTAKGKLALAPTLITVYLGCLTGITISYLIGLTCGAYVIKRFGRYLGLTSTKITMAQSWFRRMGKWILFFGYFILGIRHLSGFTAGLLKLNYPQFALFAYSGMFVWASLIFSVGYYFSHTWHQQLNILSYIGLGVGLIALGSIYTYLFLKFRRSQ